MNHYILQYLKNRGYNVSNKAEEILDEADDWYRIRITDDHRRVTVNGQGYTLARMGFAKRAAADDANLCEVVEINTGSSNDYVNAVLAENQWETQYRKQLELTSAEGTTACYIRVENATVMTDGTITGGDIRLNYIDATGYLPLTVVNDEVIEAAFWGEQIKDTERTWTLMLCTLNENGLYQYETVLFDNQGKAKPQPIVTLGDVKPFAVMRTAEVNSIEGMDGYGYPKVYGGIPIFLGLDAAFSAFLGDVDKSEAITFINEKLCGFDDAGRPIPPNESMKRRFVFLGDKLPQMDSLIQTEQPEIRVGSFREVIELLLDMMSVKFGFGTKKYDFQNGSIQTATQYIGERQDMMQELNKQRYQSTQYIQGIVRAILWFSNAFKGTAYNIDEEITVEYDDSYIENKADRLESYRQDALSGLGGVYTRALYLKEKYNLTDEEAQRWATAGDAFADEPEVGS